MTINTAAKIGVGAGIAGLAAKYFKVSDPVSLIGLAIVGQGLAWMPDFMSLCLRRVQDTSPPVANIPVPPVYIPVPNVTSLPQELQTHIQSLVTPRDAAALSLTDKAHYQARDPSRAAIFRFLRKNFVTLRELRKLLELNPDYSHPTKVFQLDSSNSNINDAELQNITQKFPNIVAIDSQNCPSLTDAGLASLATLTTLRYLNLDRCNQITDAGLRHLKNLKDLTNLVLGSWITDVGLQDLAGLSNLRVLKLYGCTRISNAGLLHLRGLTELRTLDLSFCRQITDDGLRHLERLDQLKMLRLIATGITGPGLVHIAGHIHLKTLHLPRSVTDIGLQHLSHLRNLQELYLSGTRSITLAGLQHLANLGALRRLNLAKCRGVNDDALQLLACLTNLRDLDLTFCDQISDNALQSLASFANLEDLDLGGCSGITDFGLQYLTGHGALRRLNLRYCQISDFGLAPLQTIANLNKLEVTLNESSMMTEAGLQYLEAKLPHLIVERF